MVRCRVCGRRKDIRHFYDRQVRKSGKVGECKVCTRKRVSANRAKNADYYREYDRKRFQDDPKVRARHRRYQKTERGKAAVDRSRKKWMANNPEKRAAHYAVNNAVRDGRLEKPASCQVCGATPKRIEGHHEDYTKPLDVLWLCRTCHNDAHRAKAA